MPMLYNCIKVLQDWLLPQSCLLCLAPKPTVTGLCVGCELALPWITGACPGCGAPGAPARLCGQCQRRRPRFERTVAPLPYAAPVDRLIRDLKYHGQLHIAQPLGELLARHLQHHPAPLPDRIVPVPLHRSRLRNRGYNQALEIARPVARALHLPLDHQCVQRVRRTVAQAGLPRQQRAANVRGAFVARTRLDGQRIAIIDDVMTSGHTADSLARCLRQAGAVAVEVWVVARA
jgi:ComF family protein